MFITFLVIALSVVQNQYWNSSRRWLNLSRFCQQEVSKLVDSPSLQIKMWGKHRPVTRTWNQNTSARLTKKQPTILLVKEIKNCGQWILVVCTESFFNLVILPYSVTTSKRVVLSLCSGKRFALMESYPGGIAGEVSGQKALTSWKTIINME